LNIRTSRHILTLGLVLGALASLNAISMSLYLGWIVFFSSIVGAIDFNGAFGNRILMNDCRSILFLYILNLGFITIMLNNTTVLFYTVSIAYYPIGSMIFGLLSIALISLSYNDCKTIASLDSE